MKEQSNQQRGNPLLPEAEQGAKEYLSVHHPEYPGREMRWVVKEWSRRRSRDAVKLFEDRLRQLREQLSAKQEAVFSAIALLGLGALWPDQTEHEELHEIQRLCRAHVEKWYVAARSGATAGERQRGIGFLKRVGSTMAGKGRRHRSDVTPLDVGFFYVAMLYRFQRAQRLLQVWPWSTNRAQKVIGAAATCGVPAEDLEQSLNLDYRHARDVMSLEETARFATARAFSITKHTVANKVSQALTAPFGLHRPWLSARFRIDEFGKPRRTD